ncbi:MAG TPA: hypothetical protein VIC26_06260 [Marinagarivorans sp.]
MHITVSFLLKYRLFILIPIAALFVIANQIGDPPPFARLVQLHKFTVNEVDPTDYRALEKVVWQYFNSTSPSLAIIRFDADMRRLLGERLASVLAQSDKRHQLLDRVVGLRNNSEVKSIKAFLNNYFDLLGHIKSDAEMSNCARSPLDPRSAARVLDELSRQDFERFKPLVSHWRRPILLADKAAFYQNFYKVIGVVCGRR